MFIRDTSAPARGIRLVTPNDSAELPTPARALRTGGGGTVRITDGTGTTVTHPATGDGEVIHCHVLKVWATGTTATDIVAYVDG